MPAGTTAFPAMLGMEIDSAKRLWVAGGRTGKAWVVGTTDGASWYYNFAKLPWEDPTEHIKRSPLTYVGNVKTPTMLMTGVNDLRTPMPQTEQFYSALKLRNVPTAMIRFNDEWHGTTSMPSNFVRTQLYLRYWFDKHKRGGERKTTAPSSESR